MKKLFILSLITCFNSLLFGQNPVLNWAKKLGGSGGESFRNSVIDNSGNIYTCGSFSSDTMHVGSTVLDNAGTTFGYDVFVVKYDPSGNVIWAKSAGGTAYDYIESITLDSDGNVYIVGSFSSPVISFGTISLTNTQTGQRDAYLTKYDPDGNVEFANLISGTNLEQIYNVYVDPDDNVYFTCAYSSHAVTVGTFTFNNANTASNSDDIVLAKCNSDGIVLWAESFGGVNYDKCFALTGDSDGNVYISGIIGSPSMDLGNSILITNEHPGGSDYFVAKFDPNGTVLWADTHGGLSTDNLYNLTVHNDILYGSGYFDSGFMAFETDSLFNHDTGSTDLFIVKYDLDGNLIWKLSEGGDESDPAYGIATDLQGNIYVAGSFSSQTIDFGTTSITSTLDSDIYLLKYTPDGTIDWAVAFNGNDFDGANGISTDQNGNFYLTGHFKGTIDFDPGAAVVNLTSTIPDNMGGGDAFLLKFNPELNSLQNLALTNEIKPNPTSGNILVTLGNFEQNFSYKLLTLSGQLVAEKRNLAGKEISIDLSSYVPGMYLLELETGGETELLKIIRE